MAPRLRCLSTVYGPGCLPDHRDYLTRHDSPGFDAGRLLRPLVFRERSRSLARPPSAVSDVHIARHRTHGASGSTRPRRPSVERHGASVPTRVHLPPQLRNTRVSRKLRFGTWASPSTSYGGAPAPDFHRLSGLTSLSGWLPTTLPQGSSHMAATIVPAPKRHHRNLVITLAAAAFKADLAPRHYRFPAPGDRPPKAPSAASGRRSGSDGGLRLRPPDEHHPGAHHRLVDAGHLHAGPVGVRRPQDAPATLDERLRAEHRARTLPVPSSVGPATSAPRRAAAPHGRPTPAPAGRDWRRPRPGRQQHRRRRPARAWGRIASLTQTCKMNGVEPYAWLKRAGWRRSPPAILNPESTNSCLAPSTAP